MSYPMSSESRLWKSAAYAAHHSDLQTAIKGKGSVATTSVGSGQNAILEPSGTSIVIMAEGMVSRPQAAFSLMQCSVDPFTEHFLPDIAWTLDGKYLCALTTHGQLFLLSAAGDLQQHWPGPLNGQEHYGGSFPVSFAPLPGNKLCVLCADASIHLLDIASSTCKAFPRIKSRFQVGRTVTYCPQTHYLLLVGNGAAFTAASGTTAEEKAALPQPRAQPLSKSGAVLVAWALTNLNRPKLLFTSQSSSKQPPTEVSVPLQWGSAWRSCMSPDGSFAAVLEPGSGWHLLATPQEGPCQEIQLPAPQISGNDSENGADTPVATSVAWGAESCALTVWSDCKVYRVVLRGGKDDVAEVVTTGVSVALGAVVAKLAGGQEDAEGPLGELPKDSNPLVVIEPEWEDGATLEQGGKYTGTESEMSDRKGVHIPNKFGTTNRIIGWRVSHLLSSPPSNAIASMFSTGAPPTSETVTRALELAQASGVSPVSVWQQMWESSKKQEADVARLVESTSGHPEAASFLWQEACGVTASSTAAVRALLVAAITAQDDTEMHTLQECIRSNSDVSTLDESTLAACESRMALLQRLDSVDTYCALHGMHAEVAGLREMITAGMADAAVSFAAAGNIPALCTVLSRHACSIRESQLAILHYLPDSMDAATYLPVLQQIAWWDGSIARERDLDALESAEVAVLLADHIMTRVEPTDPFLRAVAVSRDPESRSDGITIEAVDAWVVERALLVDESTGLLPISTNLLKGWLRLGRETVAPTLTGLHMMQTLFRHAHVLDESIAAEVAGLNGRDFVAQTVPAQVQYVLRAVFPHESIEDAHYGAAILTEVVAPALSVVPDREAVLESLLQMEFPESPEWIVSLVKADLQADSVLFGNFSFLSAAVLRLVNNYIPEKSTQSTPQWPMLLHVVDAVHAAARTPSVLSETQRDRWVEKLEQAAARVRGARILSKHGMHLPACALSAADRRGACGLLRSMLTTAAASASASDDPSGAFGRIWSDCRDLHFYVFEVKNLSLAYILREFLRAALLAQQWDVAERYMKGTPHVKLSKSGTALTLGSAARDMFVAAKIVSASDPALAACIRTLSLASSTYPELQSSLDLVNALRVASAEIGAPIDKTMWESLAFAGIFSSPTATSSCASLASPIHSEAAGIEPVDLGRLPEKKRQLLDSALEAAAAAPAAHYESLCELVALLYGSEDVSLGVPSSSRSGALLIVAESLANSPGGQRFAVDLAMQLCDEGYQPAWRLASQLGCSAALTGGDSSSAPGYRTSAPGAISESVGGWDDASQQLTAFALASCDEAALPQMLAAAEVQALQHSSALYGNTQKRTSAGGSELSGAQLQFAIQILGLASGCAAVDGVLAEVSQLLQGGMRGAQPPAVQACLEHAAVRCVGLAGQAPGDSSAHTCGLSTAATACMLEMARMSGTESLTTLTDNHPLPKEPRQRTQLLQCAVRSAALQVMHTCNVSITRELLHQPLDTLVATARNTQRSTPSPTSADAAATLETLQGRLESHQRDLELRAALGNDSTSMATNITTRSGAATTAVPRMEPPLDGAAAPAIVTEHPSEQGRVQDPEAGAGLVSTYQERDALLELASRCGEALASGGDATHDIQKALKLARGYDVDTWWVHWGITQSAVTSWHPGDVLDTSLLATLATHSKQLLSHAEAALWLLFTSVLPDLDQSFAEPSQWLCFASIAAQCAGSVSDISKQHQQFQSVVECCTSPAMPQSLEPALAPMIFEAACSIMQPFWSAHAVPELIAESVSGPQAVPAPAQHSALQALYENSEVQHTPQLRAVLSQWPMAQPGGSNNSINSSARSQGVCGIDREAADIIALVKLLSGAAGQVSSPAEVVSLACESISALSGPTAIAVASFCASGVCEGLLPHTVTGGVLSPVALHPSATHALLHAHPALSKPSQDALPSSVAAMRTLADTWQATKALLSQPADPASLSSMHDKDASSGRVWLLEHLDAANAHVLSLAEAAVQTAQATGAPSGAQEIAYNAVSQGVSFEVLARAVPSLLAALSGAGDSSQTAAVSSDVDLVLLNACVQQSDVVVAVLAGEAEAGNSLQPVPGTDTEGLTMLRSLVGVLDGSAAAELPSGRQAREALLQKLQTMERSLGGAAMSSSVMQSAVSLRAELVTPERWGSDCGGGAQSILHARGRAALGALWGSNDPLRAQDFASMDAMEARVVELVQAGASLEQLHALFVLVKDVLAFGSALGSSSAMHGAVGSISKGITKAEGSLSAGLHVLLCCPSGNAEARAVQVQGVSEELQASGRPWAASAVCMVAGSDVQHTSAVQRLLGDSGSTAVDSQLLEHAAELTDASVLGAVLWGLCRAGGATARTVMLAPVSLQVLRPALQVLPAVGVTGAVYECALPRLVAHMCTEGANAGLLVAGDIIAEYTGLHVQLRRPEGLCANLAAYLRVSVERSKVVLQNHACVESVVPEVWGYGVDAELVGMLLAAQGEVQAQLDTPF